MDDADRSLPGSGAQAAPGTVYWITGLAGAGKSTLGRLLTARLRAESGAAVFLDGDVMRTAFGEDCAYGLSDRRRLAGRYARCARMLAEQGLHVVCAVIAMFEDVRAWSRAHIPSYVEVYLDVPLCALRARDRKGLYAGASGAAGPEGAQVVGLDLPFEPPEQPDLVFAAHGETNPADLCQAILDHAAARAR
jgi:adenylylsulfate kinase-like enzyme